MVCCIKLYKSLLKTTQEIHFRALQNNRMFTVLVGALLIGALFKSNI